MNLSDLQRKDIVNIDDGKRLGKIIDAYISETGTIEYFNILEKKFWAFWRTSNETTINFSQIKKIGEDVILVKI